MKRRNFFGSLAGLIAAPVAAKVMESIPEPAPSIVVSKYSTPVKGWEIVDGMTCMCTSVSDASYYRASSFTEPPLRCEYCARIIDDEDGTGHCTSCGAPV